MGDSAAALLRLERRRAEGLQQENAALRARLETLQHLPQQQGPKGGCLAAASGVSRSSAHDDLLQRLREHVKAALSEGAGDDGGSSSSARALNSDASGGLDSRGAVDAGVGAGEDTAARGDQRDSGCGSGGSGCEGPALEGDLDSLRQQNSRLARSVTVLRQLVDGPRRRLAGGRGQGVERLRASAAQSAAAGVPVPSGLRDAQRLSPVRASTGSMPELAAAAAHWGGARLLGQGLSNNAAAQRARRSLQSQLQHAGEKLRSSIHRQQKQQEQQQRQQEQRNAGKRPEGPADPCADSGGASCDGGGLSRAHSDAAGAAGSDDVLGASGSVASSSCSGGGRDGPPVWSAEMLAEENALLSQQLQSLMAQNAELRLKLQQRDAALARADELLAQLTSPAGQPGDSEQGSGGAGGGSPTSADQGTSISSEDACAAAVGQQQQQQQQQQSQEQEHSVVADADMHATADVYPTDGSCTAEFVGSEMLLALEGELQLLSEDQPSTSSREQASSDAAHTGFDRSGPGDEVLGSRRTASSASRAGEATCAGSASVSLQPARCSTPDLGLPQASGRQSARSGGSGGSCGSGSCGSGSCGSGSCGSGSCGSGSCSAHGDDDAEGPQNPEFEDAAPAADGSVHSSSLEASGNADASADADSTDGRESPSSSGASCSARASRLSTLSDSPSFEELRQLTAELRAALTDRDKAARHAAQLRRQMARVQRRRRRLRAMSVSPRLSPPGRRHARAAASPPSAPQSAFSAAAGGLQAAAAAARDTAHTDAPDGCRAALSAGETSDGDDDGTAATLADLVTAVGALSDELAAVAGDRYTSASLLSGFLEGSPTVAAARPCLPPGVQAAVSAAELAAVASPPGSREAARAQRRVRAIASGLQVSSAAELGAARASEALRRQALALGRELSGLKGLPRAPNARGGGECCSEPRRGSDGDAGARGRPPLVLDGDGGPGDCTQGEASGGTCLAAAFDAAASDEWAAEGGSAITAALDAPEPRRCAGSSASSGLQESPRLFSASTRRARGQRLPEPGSCLALLREREQLSEDLRGIREQVAAALSASSGGCSLRDSLGGSVGRVTPPAAHDAAGSAAAGLGPPGLPSPASAASPGSAGRGSFAFGSGAFAEPRSAGASVSVSFSGFAANSQGPTPRSQARAPGRSVLLPLAPQPTPASAGDSARDDGSPVFVTPLWLRRLSGRSDAHTQTPPDEAAAAAEAAARVAAEEHSAHARQLEGRLFVLQQQLQEVEVRLRISAEMRDNALAALAAAREQQQRQFGAAALPALPEPMDPALLSPGPSPRLPESRVRELQDTVRRQAACIEQLQVALAAAMVASPPSPAARSWSPSDSIGSAAAGRGRLAQSPGPSPESGSVGSTPAKSPVGAGAPGGCHEPAPTREGLCLQAPLAQQEELAAPQQQAQGQADEHAQVQGNSPGHQPSAEGEPAQADPVLPGEEEHPEGPTGNEEALQGGAQQQEQQPQQQQQQQQQQQDPCSEPLPPGVPRTESPQPEGEQAATPRQPLPPHQQGEGSEAEEVTGRAEASGPGEAEEQACSEATPAAKQAASAMEGSPIWGLHEQQPQTEHQRQHERPELRQQQQQQPQLSPNQHLREPLPPLVWAAPPAEAQHASQPAAPAPARTSPVPTSRPPSSLDMPRSRGGTPVMTPRSTFPRGRSPVLTPRCTTPTSPPGKPAAR